MLRWITGVSSGNDYIPLLHGNCLGYHWYRLLSWRIPVFLMLDIDPIEEVCDTFSALIPEVGFVLT